MVVFLDEKEIDVGVIVVFCMYDECSKWGLDCILVYVFGVLFGLEFFLLDYDRIDVSSV